MVSLEILTATEWLAVANTTRSRPRMSNNETESSQPKSAEWRPRRRVRRCSNFVSLYRETDKTEDKQKWKRGHYTARYNETKPDDGPGVLTQENQHREGGGCRIAIITKNHQSSASQTAEPIIRKGVLARNNVKPMLKEDVWILFLVVNVARTRTSKAKVSAGRRCVKQTDGRTDPLHALSAFPFISVRIWFSPRRSSHLMSMSGHT